MKKAQMQMMETIAVLLVFAVIAVLGFAFFMNLQKGTIEQSAQEARDLESIQIAQRASELPELQCSSYEVVDQNCVDKYLIEATSSKFHEQGMSEYYFDLFGYTKITVKQIFPSGNTWTVYNRERPDSTSTTVTNFPILISDPVQATNSFGVITIEVYR